MGHLILELILYLFLGLFVLFNPKYSFAATINLVLPPSVKFNQEFDVKIYLDTKSEKTVGTDLLINYNPQNYTFVKAIPGKLYSVYHPVKVYSEKNNIRYSGTNNYNNYKNANGLFATLVFSSKISAKPEIGLQWEKNKTNDTNVIGVKGEDLLNTSPVISYSKSLENKPTEKRPINEPTDIPQPGEILGETDVLPTQNPTFLPTNLLNTSYPKVTGTDTIRRLAIFIIILVFICLASLGFILLLMSKKRKERETKE